jgi:hypothetical protein
MRPIYAQSQRKHGGDAFWRTGGVENFSCSVHQRSTQLHDKLSTRIWLFILWVYQSFHCTVHIMDLGKELIGSVRETAVDHTPICDCNKQSWNKEE